MPSFNSYLLKDTATLIKKGKNSSDTVKTEYKEKLEYCRVKIAWPSFDISLSTATDSHIVNTASNENTEVKDLRFQKEKESVKAQKLRR